MSELLKDAAYKAFDEGRTVQYVANNLGLARSYALRIHAIWKKEHPDAPKSNWRNVVYEMRKKGMTDEEIQAETGYRMETIKKAQAKPNAKKAQRYTDIVRTDPVDNRNAKMCKSCIYRFDDSNLSMNSPKCNYIGITGHMRGCKAERCTKYQAGSRIDMRPFEYH